MTTVPVLHEVVCSFCGHSLLEFSETEVSRVGPCCENLPEPYNASSDGFFNETDDVRDPDDDCDCEECQYFREHGYERDG